MIGKLKKGASFGDCVRYVTGKDEAKILASDGVLLGTNAEIVQSLDVYKRQLSSFAKTDRVNFNETESASIYYGIMASAVKHNIELDSKALSLIHIYGCGACNGRKSC